MPPRAAALSRLALMLCLVALAACTGRARISYLPDAPVAAGVREVFIATTRKIENGQLGAGRSEVPHYLRYEISIPPERTPGAIPIAGRKTDPATQFFARDIDLFPRPKDFEQSLRRSLRTRDGVAVIYVHGFNNTFDEGVLRITQLAEDFQFPGVAVHYSWPSAGSPVGYAHDRDSALFARDGLEELIRLVKRAGAREIVLVGHSMGALLSMEALRQMAIARPGSVARMVDGVVLISPDIDVDVFRAQVRRIGTLPDPFGIFVSRRDRVLQLSARLSGQKNRLGNVDEVERVKDLKVTIVDVTEFSTGVGHFTPGTNPLLIRLFAGAGALADAFRGDRAGRTGLGFGTVLVVQEAVQVILSPVQVLAR